MFGNLRGDSSKAVAKCNRCSQEILTSPSGDMSFGIV